MPCWRRNENESTPFVLDHTEQFGEGVVYLSSVIES